MNNDTSVRILLHFFGVKKEIVEKRGTISGKIT